MSSSTRAAARAASSTHAVLQRPGGLVVVEPKRTVLASAPVSAANGSAGVTGPAAPDALVIVLHGLGDSAAGWTDTVHSYLAPRLPHARFVLPSAKKQPVTINAGMPSPSWFDIESLGRALTRAHERCAGIDASEELVWRLVDEFRRPCVGAAAEGAGASGTTGSGAGSVEAGVIPLSRVVLMGFSQGGALSLYCGLRQPRRLGGIAVLSAYMPLADGVAAAFAKRGGADVVAGDSVLDTPVAFFHGLDDETVPIEAGRDAEQRTRALGIKSVFFREIEDLGHGANLKELRQVSEFLESALPPL